MNKKTQTQSGFRKETYILKAHHLSPGPFLLGSPVLAWGDLIVQSTHFAPYLPRAMSHKRSDDGTWDVSAATPG